MLCVAPIKNGGALQVQYFFQPFHRTMDDVRTAVMQERHGTRGAAWCIQDFFFVVGMHAVCPEMY